MGRPSGYSEEIATLLLEQIAEGASLRSICLDPEMPGLRTVFDWLDEREDFRTKYARAREIQGDVMDDKILTVANECTPETAHADKVKIAAYQWRAAKLAPKKYGEKTQQEISGPDGSPLTIGWVNAASPSPVAGDSKP